MRKLATAILGNLLTSVLPTDTPFLLIIFAEDAPHVISNSARPKQIVEILRHVADGIEGGADMEVFNAKEN